jgi:hypothetical protein
MHAKTGVGAAGVLDLKAELYRQQQEAQLAKEDPAAAAARQSRRTAGIDLSLHARRNSGVEQRDRRDREQTKVTLIYFTCRGLKGVLKKAFMSLNSVGVSSADA